MAGHGPLLNVLRGGGYRLTPQRLMILSIMHESLGHISAEEIYALLRERYPYIDISTVYRNLHLLKRLGLIHEARLEGDTVRFELAKGEQHHHLICRRCGRSFGLGNDILKPLRAALQKGYSFEAELEHLAIFGLCAECQGEPAPGSPPSGTIHH
ncbi:MAG TPA: Fur family transcriptional regulator [Dehalococcoidia bacterium]|nr:Fur family transcriptional regulator [Dehalococcoidia bacterium]